MADFRKLLLALIAGALIFGTAASAADFSCQVSGVPTLVRSEGVADYVGDVLMTCAGVLPLTDVPNGVVANIRLSFLGQPVIITSKIVSSAARKISEATLVLNNALAPDGLTRAPIGYFSTGGVLQPQTNGTQNVYQALWLNDQELEWQGVMLSAPGSTNVEVSVRMTNVRINAQALAVGAPINAQINITSPTSIPIYGNSSVLVANIRQGLLQVSNLGATVKGCDLPAAPNHFTSFTTSFQEGFGTAFRPMLNTFAGAVPHYVPGGGYFDESGYNPVGLGTALFNGGALSGGSLVGLEKIGLASQGTQLGITVTGVPAGLTLTFGTITTTNDLVVSAGTVSGTGTVTMKLEVMGYAGTGDAQFLQDTITVPIIASYTALPVVGSAIAHGRLLPDAGGKFHAEVDTVPVPRFVDSSTTPDANVIALQACRTLLLFPYLTSSAGYNSGIAITNTSVDPLGAPLTTPQAGACTLSFYGQSSLTALTASQGTQTIISVPAGGQFITNLAVGAKGNVYGRDGSKTAACNTTGTNTCPDMPAYVGYMIASCDFQWAHGFAFVTDTGSDRTMGYLALVIPDRSDGRLPQNADRKSRANQGEQLGF
jgi:hypothetical protein